MSLFLGNSEINYQGENDQEVCMTTLKKFEDYVCFSSCFCLVKEKLPVAGVAKLEMCVVIGFLHAEGVNWLTLKEIFQSLPLEIHF